MPAFVVSGASMNPDLRDGDLVLARRLKRPPSPGEVIVYRHLQEDFPIVHRVSRSTASGVWTAGDANAGPDPAPVPADRVVGKVCAVLPRIGRLVRLVRRRPS